MCTGFAYRFSSSFFVNINIETFTNAPSIDLKPYVLEILVLLMRSQARECIHKRIQMETPRDYENILIESQTLSREYKKIHYDIQNNFINFPDCWQALIPLKTEYFKALTHLYYAKNLASVTTMEKHDKSDEKNRLKIIKVHLQTAQSSHEEILRLQRMCRELRVSLYNTNSNEF